MSNEWISVKERLPEEGKYVLCYCNTNFAVAAHYDGPISMLEPHDVWLIDLDDAALPSSCSPTHWMELPNKPVTN